MRIELRLAVSETVSVGVCAVIAIAAWLHDPPARRAWAARPATGGEVDVIDPAELGLPAPAAAAVPAAAAAAVPAAAAAPAAARGSGSRSGRADDPARLDETVARYAAALAGDPDAPDARSPAGDLNAQIVDARQRAARAEIGHGGELDLPDADDVPLPGTVRRVPPPRGPEQPVTQPPKQEHPRKDRVVLGRPEPLDHTSLTPEMVLDRIQDVYLRGLQRCYRDLLEDDPTARGKVKLSLTVNESGRLAEASARTDYGSLSTCIEKRMAGWSFPEPRDGDGDPTDAAFALTLALQPE